MRQTKFRNRLVTLVGVFMLLGGALMYALPAHVSQGSNGITTNGIHVNGNSLNGLSWQATTSQGELPAQRQGKSLAFHTRLGTLGSYSIAL
jgi:hypothetical protein